MLSKGCKVAEVNPMETGVVSWQLKKAAIEVVWNVHKKLTINSSDHQPLWKLETPSLQVLSLAQTDLPAQEGSKGKLRIDRCLDPFT